MVRGMWLTALLAGVFVNQGTAAPVPPGVPTKLYQARLEAARQAFKLTLEGLRTGTADADKAYLWSTRWLEAERPLCKTQAERVAACTAHLKRMEELLEMAVARFRVGRAAKSDVVGLEFYVAEARVWEAEAKAK